MGRQLAKVNNTNITTAVDLLLDQVAQDARLLHEHVEKLVEFSKVERRRQHLPRYSPFTA